MQELQARQKLEVLVRFMMAGDGSFKQRLSETYRHPTMGLRQIPMNFFPGSLRPKFKELMESIDKNESKNMKKVDKMALMDELFFLYRDLDEIIRSQQEERRASTRQG
jgi:hypothetical protein